MQKDRYFEMENISKYADDSKLHDFFISEDAKCKEILIFFPKISRVFFTCLIPVECLIRSGEFLEVLIENYLSRKPIPNKKEVIPETFPI